VILTTHSMEECEALCPRIGIMANGHLRCLGSAQHLKNRFGQGFQIEMKVEAVNKTDADYVENVHSLNGSNDDEEAPDASEAPDTAPDTRFFKLDEALEALRALTGDDFLADMVQADSHIGYGIWKDATSAVGCPLDELVAFATAELRLRNVEEFIKANYPGFVLRERQDSKVRYEVPSEGVRVSSIFASIEGNKSRLRLSDYGVSQTSLEQVFNMHAAEAEKLKQGRMD
jgi:ATP-binding cassette subfamily A (ABC1) protein 3